MNNVIKMAEPLEPLAQIGKRIDRSYDRTQRGRMEWMEGTLDLASALAEAKACFPSNAAFGRWLADNGHDRVSHQDRAALINMASADAIETTRIVLSETDRTSWRYIWENEIEPRLTCAGKTAEAAQPTPQISTYVARLKKFCAATQSAIDRATPAEAAVMNQIAVELDRLLKELEAAS